MTTEAKTVNIRGSLHALSAAKENINRATRALGTPDQWQTVREIGVGALIAIPCVLLTIWMYRKKVKELTGRPIAVIGEDPAAAPTVVSGFDVLGV